MAMGREEQAQLRKLIKRFVESSEPTEGHLATFWENEGVPVYAGIISKWPMIASTDREWGSVQELDAIKPPFAGKVVKFYSMITGN